MIMDALAIIQLSLTGLILMALLSFQYKPGVSRFELERLASSERHYKNKLKFLQIYPGLRILVYILALIDVIFICSITMFAWGFLGSLLAFAIVMLAFFMSRAVSKIVKELIEKNFAWFNKYFTWAEVLGKIVISGDEPKIHSKQELAHLIETGDFIEVAEKMILLGSIEFIGKKVSDVMVKRDDIVSVKANDIVGPKLLDELHQSGHLIFPVVRGKDFIGMLHVEDVISLDQGEKPVTDAMRKVPTAIQQDANLESALSEMKDDHSCQLLVVDNDDKLVGMIDLSDIVKVLMGRKTD